MNTTTRPTATLIGNVPGFNGVAKHYRLSEPLKGHSDVIVSAVDNPGFGGPETYIFPTDESGSKVTDWGELPGSFRGDLDHVAALDRAGYDVA